MSDEGAGAQGLDVTLREFASGQKLFGRYTLIKTLGRGGMGVVWLARDEELERNVALKFLPELVIHDRALLGDLKRETKRSLDLTHKNIVRIYDFVQNPESACISMEYVDGDTLSNLRADKPRKVFEPNELTEWVSQLCDALDYAHNHARIIHRDLKPANLMVNQRGDLKVSDFGIARSISDSVSKLTMPQGKSGTLVYMSPQQLEGERGDPLDDVYSVGATFYELLTSKPPFYSGNVDRQIREKVPPSMTQRRVELEIEGGPIDETWEKVVAECLAKDPARRPQSVADIARQLEVPSPKTRRAAQVAARSSRKIPVVAGLVVLCVLAAAAWYFGPSVNKKRPGDTTAPLITAQPDKAAAEPIKPATVPKVVANAVYDGMIHAKNDGSIKVPLTIMMGGDRKSGTMTQRSHRGDVVVRFTGVWEGLTLHAVTGEVISSPEGTNWEPESFTLRFPEGGRNAAYECLADGKTYVAHLTVQSAPAVRAAPTYTGTIRVRGESRPGTALTVNLAADRKSGTMTQASKSGNTVVRFTGVWDGDILRAVTSEVISKPANIEWKPESFTLTFAEDGRSGWYECIDAGHTYAAQLSAP